MNGVLGHDSAMCGYAGPGTTWINETNFVINRALVGDSIARPVDQQQKSATTVPRTDPGSHKVYIYNRN